MTEYQKQTYRVKTLKNNVKVGDQIPSPKNDGDVGRWVDDTLLENGYSIDKFGDVDLPIEGVENKTRKRGSKAAHNTGSMTVKDIKNTKNWYKTRYYKKTLNRNTVEWDADFDEVVGATCIDLDLPEIQEQLEKAYDNLRDKILNGDTRKNITSDCKTAVLDGYVSEGSYRYRISNKAMKEFESLSRTKTTRRNLFEGL